MTETIDFITTKTITNQYSVPLDVLKEILEDNDMNYDEMDTLDLQEFIADMEADFLEYAEGEVEYSETEVEIF